MTEPIFIKTEFTHGHIANYDYGSQVRVLLRAPTAILFTGVGLSIWSPRGSSSSPSIRTLTSERVTKAVLSHPKAVAEIERVFGPGSAALALRAWTSKGSGTCLIDGGGEPMPPTRKVFRERLYADYEAATCDWKADLTGEVKTCKQCGAPLTPDTDHHRFGYDLMPNHPRTVEECQRRTNHRVIAVHGYGPERRDRWGYVSWFEVWDGESYHDENFCHGDKCAAEYGRRAALEREALEPGIAAPKPRYRIREDVNHAPEKEVMIVAGPDGQRFRI